MVTYAIYVLLRELLLQLQGGVTLAINIIKIFPPIGIARLGNSPNEFFVGPQIPGDHTPPPGGYRDSLFRIKRQAACFHLFGYEGEVLKRELTLADADINWTVELANTKADWKEFGGIEQPDLPRRNAGVADRDSLRITPGPRILNGPNQMATFDTGTFLGQPVPLGEIRTDADGRLLVLGGFGNSATLTTPPSPITNFANNDGWHDDISDGPVKAIVRLKGENTSIQASSAWVICSPPKFAPPIEHVITLYDTLLQTAVDRRGFVLPTSSLSFTKDIYPLLARAMNVKWVNKQAGAMHAHIHEVLPLPNSTGPVGSSGDRQAIFNRLRDPSTSPHDHVFRHDMPKIWSDVYDTDNKISQALTKAQYRILQQWKDWIDVVNDWVGPPLLETQITPDGLTRAALESCVGGAFYPGIETSFMIRDNYPFIEPFRLDAAQLEPGDLTKQMAVPWQTDFFDCRYEDPLLWWPAQRPDDVFLSDGSNVGWARGISTWNDMVQNWHKLGFVIQQPGTDPPQYVETERHD
jgi:L-lysine epsilon oxidase-like protein